MGTIKVVIVDDHVILRHGLRDVFENNGMEVVGEAANIAQSDALVASNKDAVFVIDLNLGEKENGFSLIAKYAALNIKMVIYSMRETVDTKLSVYRAGALAFVPKSADTATLLDAIRKVASGTKYYEPGAAEELLSYMTDGKSSSPADILSAGEYQVFIRSANGMKAEDISKALDFSIGTVHNRLSSIRKKLGCTNMEFHKIAQRHGLVP